MPFASNSRDIELPPTPVSSRAPTPPQVPSPGFTALEKANFPSIHFPLVHHDIEQCIPPPFQPLVSQSFKGWKYIIVFLDIVLFVLVTINCILGPFAFSYFGWSLVYLGLITISSFFLIHFPLYLAVKHSSKSFLLLFYFSTSLYLGFLAVEILSISTIPQYPGAVNNLQSLMMFASNGNMGAVVIAAIAFFLQVIQAGYFTLLAVKVYQQM